MLFYHYDYYYTSVLLYNTVTAIHLSREQWLESNGIAETCSISEKKLRNREHRHLPETALWQWCIWHKTEESPRIPTSIEHVHMPVCPQVHLYQLTGLGRKEKEGLEGFSVAGISLLMFAEFLLVAIFSSVSSLISPLISLLATNELIRHTDWSFIEIISFSGVTPSTDPCGH